MLEAFLRNRRPSVSHRIVTALMQQPRTARALTADLQERYCTVTCSLSALKAEGLVTNGADKIWRLVDPAGQARLAPVPTKQKDQHV